MSLSFTSEYFPDVDEITPDELQAAREEVVAWLAAEFSDIDLSPGTPTGDTIVSPLAMYRAAAEKSNSRLMSDLNLENVANGIIYSCEFVRAYLGNFGVYDVDGSKSFGVMRLVFDSPAAVTLQKANRFSFGGADAYEYMSTDAEKETINILPAGSSHNGLSDTYVLSQLSELTWAVDIPVETATITTPVVAGTAGSAAVIPAGLVGIVSVIDFLDGVPTATLPKLAKMARRLASAITAGSRSSISSMVYRNWPESNMVSPIVTGDPEMQRSPSSSALTLQQPAVDLYVRSKRDMQRVTQSFRLDYVLATGESDKTFRGKIPFLHSPSRIVSLEWSGSTTESYIDTKKVFSRPTREDLVGALHCGTRYEEFWADVAPIRDGGGTSAIPLTDVVEEEVNKQYAIFTVVYDCDPVADAIASLLESRDNKPVGVDMIVKSGPLNLVSSFTVTYRKKDGVRMLLGEARDNLSEYFREAGYPETLRPTDIHDVMRYAGADKVLGLTFSSSVRPTPADAIIAYTSGDLDLDGDWHTAANADDVVPIVIDEPAHPIDYTPATIVSTTYTASGRLNAWAATSRTIRTHLDPENINFVEA